MPEIRPFRGVRYDVARVGTLSDVVAPPYDVINSFLQDLLYFDSPYNVVRLELNRAEPDDAHGGRRYERAARFLKDWLREGILRQDDHPAFYIYHQTFKVKEATPFEVEGGTQTYTRKGFLARVRLEPIGRGKIYPHEQTLAGPRADRLALYRATGFNLSPVFGLYPDPSGEVQRLIEAAPHDHTPLVATDHFGVESRLWLVTDQETHTALSGLMAAKPIFIADGHHRYETGLKYREELLASGQITGPDDPSNFCLMMLVGMSDPGLLILPTHRLVSGIQRLTSNQLAERLTPEFEVRSCGAGEVGGHAAWMAIESKGDQDLLGFGTIADSQWLLARLRSDATMDRLAQDHSPDWRNLGVSILHVLVLDHLLAGLGQPSCRYVHSIGEVMADFASRGSDLACLVAPARMNHVETIASNLETMPPKSTYFYPKLLTGLVLNTLRRSEGLQGG
jgi:uncharacterized protein (DUF1015 family)